MNKHTLIASALLIIVNALADNIYRACWNVTLEDDMFCSGAINLPIDEETYNNRVRQDDLAKEMYRALLYKWQTRKAK